MEFEKRLKGILSLLADETAAKKIILFGSRASGSASSGSDIDLGVEGGKPLSFREKRKLKEALEERSGLYSVDLVFLEEASKEFQEIIHKTGVVLYDKERGFVVSEKT
ncbi:MAG: nucleotidyltransferase domain-containing protein [Candidatus Eremiobacteraeota bacterium]|nr:nucleotidyltransferase domain-containing protein [Candidatus Eremiobacteraeota bacterium]MCL5055837.1 nucleotidyltransferase domain-containing protein [Bacillota bacterium]